MKTEAQITLFIAAAVVACCFLVTSCAKTVGTWDLLSGHRIATPPQQVEQGAER